MSIRLKFFLRLTLAVTCGTSAAWASAPAAADTVSSDDALAKLVKGNEDFVAGTPRHPDQEVARRAALAKGQHPFAIVLTCADSRVSPELYFDQGLGDLFVLRNAGNVLDEHIIGSIEYAVEHLGAGLIIVVGHSKCGAVAATVAGGHVPGHIGSIVDSIQPAVEAVANQPGDKVDNAVRTHARFMAYRLSRTGPILSHAIAEGKLKVAAARYDLETGKVELLDLPTPPPAGHATAAPSPAAAHSAAKSGH